MLLQNVISTGSFITNLVFQTLLNNKNIRTDFGNPHLYKDGKIKYVLHCKKNIIFSLHLAFFIHILRMQQTSNPIPKHLFRSLMHLQFN